MHAPTNAHAYARARTHTRAQIHTHTHTHLPRVKRLRVSGCVIEGRVVAVLDGGENVEQRFGDRHFFFQQRPDDLEKEKQVS